MTKPIKLKAQPPIFVIAGKDSTWGELKSIFLNNHKEPEFVASPCNRCVIDISVVLCSVEDKKSLRCTCGNKDCYILLIYLDEKVVE